MHENVVLIALFGWITIGFIINIHLEKRNKEKIVELDKRLKALEKERGEFETVAAIQETDCVAVQIEKLLDRVHNLKSCYRCQLYRDKVQRDNRQTSE